MLKPRDLAFVGASLSASACNTDQLDQFGLIDANPRYVDAAPQNVELKSNEEGIGEVAFLGGPKEVEDVRTDIDGEIEITRRQLATLLVAISLDGNPGLMEHWLSVQVCDTDQNCETTDWLPFEGQPMKPDVAITGVEDFASRHDIEIPADNGLLNVDVRLINGEGNEIDSFNGYWNPNPERRPDIPEPPYEAPASEEEPKGFPNV